MPMSPRCGGPQTFTVEKNLAFLSSVSTVAIVRAVDFDNYVADQIEIQQIPGLSVAVVKDGRVLKIKGNGLAIDSRLQCRILSRRCSCHEMA